VETLAIGTIVLNDHARAADDFTRVTLLVDLAKTSPLTENLRVTDFDQVDLVFSTEGLNQLDVLGLGTGLHKDTQVSLALIESLSGFAETTGQTIVNERSLQDLLQHDGIVSVKWRMRGFWTHLQGILNGYFSLRGIGRSGLDLLLLGFFNRDVISSFRHSKKRSKQSKPMKPKRNFEIRTWMWFYK
jgi:hypothetical protein